MNNDTAAWPDIVDADVAATWVADVVGHPIDRVEVLDTKFWGLTARFEAGGESVVFKAAAPAIFPAATTVAGFAHRACPEAVPAVLASTEHGSQHWSLFEHIAGRPLRSRGAEGLLRLAETAAMVQRAAVICAPPADIPVVRPSDVARLLTDLDDLPPELVEALDARRAELQDWAEQLEALVPLSLDHVDLHLDNALGVRGRGVVILDWEEAVISCPLFSLERLRYDAADFGVPRIVDDAHVRALLPDLPVKERSRALALARTLAPIKLAHEARWFARAHRWTYRHTTLTELLVRSALAAAEELSPSRAPRAAKPMSDTSAVEVEVRLGGAGRVCREILATIPSWFGIPEANEQYAVMAETERSIVASMDGRPVGVLLLVRHTDAAAEVHLIAVKQEHHRTGIGRLMLRRAEDLLREDGVTYLQVKTLSARKADDGYARTRRFYAACGFVAFEEMPTLWDPSNPALIMIKTLEPSEGGPQS